jgi:hypothetical protein
MRARLAVGLVGLVGVVALTGGCIYIAPIVSDQRDDPLSRCAARYEDRKADLVDVRWSWLPPGHVCVFDDGEGTMERRLRG